MKELLYRTWLCLLMLAWLLLFARSLWAQPPAESSMGTFPVPKVVGMSGTKLITIDVSPRISMAALGHESQIRVRVHILSSPRNRFLDIVWLGDKSGSEQIQLDDKSAVTFTKFIPIPTGEYAFFACLEQIDKTVCTKEESVSVQ